MLGVLCNLEKLLSQELKVTQKTPQNNMKTTHDQPKNNLVDFATEKNLSCEEIASALFDCKCGMQAQKMHCS